MRRLLISTALLALVVAGTSAQEVLLPQRPDSVRFALIGDSGTGGSAQQKIADRLAAARERFPFTFVLMMGDNLYGRERPRDYASKFERPYKSLLDAGVKFYASLGNHDDPEQRLYKPFNMDGKRYYTFKPPGASVRFFALDSSYMAKEQLEWLDKELAASGSDWKIAFFHHPLYSSGETHGSDEVLRKVLEPLFLQHEVDVVFTGHEHFYERLKPQKGIHYFILGNSAKLRRGNITRTPLTAKGFDEGYAFMLLEIAGNELHYQAISDTGKTIDHGVIQRRSAGTAQPD